MAGGVYFLRPIGADGPVKIGFSAHPPSRLATYAAWSPVPLEIAAVLPAHPEVERRFHAAFAAHHSHHEWFSAAPEITAAIEAIRAGAFDLATLPEPRDVRTRARPSRESIDAGRMTRRLSMLRKAGVSIPDDVWDAQYTYRQPPEEVARRRAIVRDFVLRHQRPAPRQVA